MDWDFWKNNKDTIETIFTVIGGLIALGGVIWAVFKWGVSRWWVNRVRGEVKVFELITDPTTLLPKLYATENDNSPLADHNIKYQPRDPERDIQAELKAALNRSRYLLVTAPTGYGKTREAGMLAQTMMLEGWRVLRIRTGWLDMPKTLPEELGGNRSRVLIFLDDLNGLFATGNLTQSPRVETEKSLLLSQSSYHDRLLQVLDMFEGMCTESEIRVIATARSEEEQWKVLEFSQYDRLWKRFERVELPEPLDTAIINLLEDTTKQADIKGNENEFEAIARKSDGTYRNILLNLRRWRSQNAEVDKNDFTETLDGSWRDIYERAIKKHPAVKYVYDAMDILQQARVELFLFFIEPTAMMLWGGNYFQRFLHQRKITQAINYLTKETAILRLTNEIVDPSDGQIEAGRNSKTWKSYKFFLTNLILKISNKNTPNSIYGLSISLFQENNFEESMKLTNRYIELYPSSPDGYNMRGFIFANLKENEEAEYAYHKAINLIETPITGVEPKYIVIYHNLSYLLQTQSRYDEAESILRKAFRLNSEDVASYLWLGNILERQKRYTESEDAFQKAIELNPENAYSYSLLGNLFKVQKRFKEAEVAYRKAFEILPTDFLIYYQLGDLLDNQERFEEAEAIYRKVTELKPEESYAYSRLGTILEKLKRIEEAEAIYRKSIEIKPEDYYSYYLLGNLLKDQKRIEEAESFYRNAFNINPTNRSSYDSLGNLLDNQERFEEAEAIYRKVIELKPEEDYAYTGLGTILEKLNRFEEAEAIYRKIIELKPEDNHAYNKLGTILEKLNRFEEAEIIYRKSIDIKPEDAFSYYYLGILLQNKKLYDEAVAAYRKAFEIRPADFFIYHKLVVLLNNQKRFGETEAIYRKVIELKPNDDYVYFSLGRLLQKLGRYDEAESTYRKAVEINPEDYNLYLGIASVKRIMGEAIDSGFLEKARQYIPEGDFYNKACLESICNNFELAFEYLQKAAQKEAFDHKWAWEDSDLQWIRNDPRFTEIVGPKPE